MLLTQKFKRNDSHGHLLQPTKVDISFSSLEYSNGDQSSLQEQNKSSNNGIEDVAYANAQRSSANQGQQQRKEEGEGKTDIQAKEHIQTVSVHERKTRH